MTNTTPYTILLLMKATPQWLSLSRAGRSAAFEKHVAPVLKNVQPQLQVRLFDSEYFHAGVSDFMLVTAPRLHDYELLIEMLRDTPVYSEPWFEVKDIIAGRENNFEYFNQLFQQNIQ